MFMKVPYVDVGGYHRYNGAQFLKEERDKKYLDKHQISSYQRNLMRKLKQ